MDKEEIAKRLRRFGEWKYRSMRLFAEDLEMSPSALHSAYLAGRNLPGSPLLIRLLLLGCDINWLLSGVGRAPNPTIEEARAWMLYCAQQSEYWTAYVDLEEKRPLIAQELRMVAEPPVEYKPTPKKKRTKK